MAIGAGIAAGGAVGAAVLSSRSASKLRKQAAAEAARVQANIDAAVAELEKVGIPTIEAQKIAITRFAPEIQGVQQAEQLAESALAEIEIDPRLQDAQQQALAELQERGKAGLTEEDLAKFGSLQRGVGGQEQARQQSILQSLAERGAGGAGSELAARLASSQASADRASVAGTQLGAEAASARRQALSQAGQLAGNMGQQQFAQQAAVGGARDVINKFNVQNRAQVAAKNLSERQRISEAGQALGVQQEIANKQLIQQKFQNDLSKAQSLATARTGAAQLAIQRAGALGQAAGDRNAAGMQLAGSLAGAGATLLAIQRAGALGQAAGDRNAAGMQLAGSLAKKADGGINHFQDGGAQRVDKQVDEGRIGVNPIAQEELLAAFRGEISPDQLSDDPILEPTLDTLPIEQTNGRIIDGESFFGDQLPDRVNAGESVNNLEMQDTAKKLLTSKETESKGLKKLLQLLGS